MTPSSVLHRENFLSIFWMYTSPECKKQYAHPICGSDSGSPVCCVALRLCGVLILHSPSLWLLETSPPKTVMLKLAHFTVLAYCATALAQLKGHRALTKG